MIAKKNFKTLTALSLLALPAAGQPAVIDNANWVGTDDLGRKLPGFEVTGPSKPDRWVGLFYWQWHGTLRCIPDNYDMTEFLKKHPGYKDFTANPPGGPHVPEFYWAQPAFGYYRSTDPWVIRKHLVLFADAGVDYLFLDYTNSQVYDAELTALLQVAEELKSKGVKVPQLAFFLNHQPEWKIEHLYKEWFKPGKHDAMWFRWDGKPLILAPVPKAPIKMKDPSVLPEMLAYFTWRPTWALFDSKKDPQKWRFMDVHPQRPAMGPDGKIEQMVVSKSMGGPLWKNMEIGGVSCVPGHKPIYNDQWLSPDAGKGLFFQEQWKVANKVVAPMLMVTGWNEWKAGTWDTPGVVFLGRKTVKGQGHIVDEFNMDFNRDLEPMSGGYRDNYYCQFVANMRFYKGMAAPQSASAAKTMGVAQSLKSWDDVRPIYHDANGDIANRDHDSVIKNIHYTDTSARNDIVMAQVARDAMSLTFHVQTANSLSPAADANWMMLLVDADANTATGWNGYDFLVNRTRSGGHCSVERNVGNKWYWEKVMAATALRIEDKDLLLEIPRQALGVDAHKGKLKLDFKWVDNIPESPDLMSFYGKGDVAPDGRFNYRFAEP